MPFIVKGFVKESFQTIGLGPRHIRHDLGTSRGLMDSEICDVYLVELFVANLGLLRQCHKDLVQSS